MPLTWDDAASTFRDDAGEAMTADAIVALRDAWLDRAGESLAAIARAELGEGEDAATLVEFSATSVARFAGRFMQRLGELAVESYTYARGGVSALTERDWESLTDLIGKQAAYARGFVDDLKAGKLSPAQAAARAASYVTPEPWEMGKAGQLGIYTLACRPASGCTRCQSRCRCHLDFASSPDTMETLVYWRTTSGNVCPDCAALGGQWSPLRVSRGA